MTSSGREFRLITQYGVPSYACGLKAGERVRLRKALVIRDASGRPTGEVHPAGEEWTVLTGSAQDPGVVWFLEPNGERHTWDDSYGIFEWLERIEA